MGREAVWGLGDEGLRGVFGTGDIGERHLRAMCQQCLHAGAANAAQPASDQCNTVTNGRQAIERPGNVRHRRFPLRALPLTLDQDDV